MIERVCTILNYRVKINSVTVSKIKSRKKNTAIMYPKCFPFRAILPRMSKFSVIKFLNIHLAKKINFIFQA